METEDVSYVLIPTPSEKLPELWAFLKPISLTLEVSCARIGSLFY